MLESFFHNIVNLSSRRYPEIEFSSRGLKKKIKKYNFHLFPSQFYSFDRTKDIFPRIFLETISRYISLFFPKDIFLETVERQWGKRWNSVGGKGGRKEGRNWRADCQWGGSGLVSKVRLPLPLSLPPPSTHNPRESGAKSEGAQTIDIPLLAVQLLLFHPLLTHFPNFLTPFPSMLSKVEGALVPARSNLHTTCASFPQLGN